MAADISLSLLQREHDRLKRELDVRMLADGDNTSFKGDTAARSTGGGDGGDMNARITNLERDLTEVRISLGKVDTRIEGIKDHMLTKGQAAMLALGVVVALLGAGWWVVQQYLAPLISHIPK